MKAKPMKSEGKGLIPCSVEEATHVMMEKPGPLPNLIIPVILKGSRAGTNCWSWNGDTEKPTLKPSVLQQCGEHRCHTWITDGNAIFLRDCSHEFAGKTLPLNEVD